MTTADDSPAITSMEAVHDATIANDDPGAITSGAVDETATAGIDVPAVNTSGTATDVMVAADASPWMVLQPLEKLATKSNKNQQINKNGAYFNIFYCTAVVLLTFADFC